MQIFWNSITSAIQLFIKVSGVVPESQTVHINFGSKMSDLNVLQAYEKIKKAESTDPSGIIRALLFKDLFTRWVSSRTVELTSVISGEVESAITILRRIKDIMDSPEVSAPLDEYGEGLRKTLISAGYDGKVVDNIPLLANLTETAMDVMEFDLKQFSRCPPGDFGEVYVSDTILHFRNDAEAVKFAAGSRRPSFIAVCYVIDQAHPIFSHFMFLLTSSHG